jgi:hypothetical protein
VSYFSVVQRKIVAPNDFTHLDQASQRLANFQQRYKATARPLRWRFTPADLDDLLARIDWHSSMPPPTIEGCMINRRRLVEASTKPPPDRLGPLPTAAVLSEPLDRRGRRVAGPAPAPWQARRWLGRPSAQRAVGASRCRWSMLDRPCSASISS